ncbi:cell wall metabolism sensor histidine kinase WalK [Pedobacter sp. L105]|uniref:sensor histidine kinase n=1 Tax=Pedobacter sp. L105 TaxID=1641871 RepID=UPI00131A8266|nr:ATP-binding protein [Pedobacter sp. L105]
MAERQKSDFITIASHELKTPLTTIRAYVQMLLSRVSEEGDSFKINALTRVDRQVNKMALLIQNFLNNARLADGNLQLEKAPIDMRLLLNEVANDAKILSHTHKVILIDTENLFVMADQQKITQVLENLISNAVKYSATGTQIIMRCEKYGNNVRVSISDQGIGISKRDQGKMFDRFYRVRNENVKNVAGFGIGLYLVAEILRLHESKIYVESKVDEGTKFYFDLPMIR